MQPNKGSKGFQLMSINTSVQKELQDTVSSRKKRKTETVHDCIWIRNQMTCPNSQKKKALGTAFPLKKKEQILTVKIMQEACENGSMVWCFQKQKPETGNTEALPLLN